MSNDWIPGNRPMPTPEDLARTVERVLGALAIPLPDEGVQERKAASVLYRAGYADGCQQERAAVVAWLRAQASMSAMEHKLWWQRTADAIERGAHLEPA